MTQARTERLLLGGVLGMLLLVAGMDNSSDTAAQMRTDAPWTAWLALRAPKSDPSKPPVFYLLVYGWDSRRLHMIHMPETSASTKAYATAFGRLAAEPTNAATPAAERALAQFYRTELQSWIGPHIYLRWVSNIDDP